MAAVRKEFKDTEFEIPRGSTRDILCLLGDRSYPVLSEKVVRSYPVLSEIEGLRENESDDYEADEAGISEPDKERPIVASSQEGGESLQPSPVNEMHGARDRSNMDAVLAAIKRIDERVKNLEKGKDTEIIPLRALFEERSNRREQPPRNRRDREISNKEIEEIIDMRSSGMDGRQKTAQEKQQRRKKSRNSGRKSKSKLEYDSESSLNGSDPDSSDDSNIVKDDDWFREFAKQPFKSPTLTCKRACPGMLRRILENRLSVTEYVEREKIGLPRNRKESLVLARIMDFLIADFGILKMYRNDGMEVAIRRLSAIITADQTGSWEAATHIEDGHVGLLSQKQRKEILEAARLERATRKSAGNRFESGKSTSAQRDTNDKRPTKKQKVGQGQ